MTTALSLSRPAFGELRGNWPVFLPELHERFADPAALHLPEGCTEVWQTPGWLSHLEAYGRSFDFSALGRLNVTGQLQSQFAALLLGLLAHQPRVSVLDVGGSIGENALAAFAALHPGWLERIDWTVCDGRASVEIGERTWQSVKDSPVRFWSSDELARQPGRFDLILVSGTLQCLNEPHQVLASLAERLTPSSPGIYIRRTKFVLSGDRHGVVRQLIFPVHGEGAGRYAGELQGHVFCLPRMVSELGAMGLVVRYINYYQPYPLPGVPAPFHNAHYIDLLIGRT